MQDLEPQSGCRNELEGAEGVIGRIGAFVRDNRLVLTIAVCSAIFLFLLFEVLRGEIMRIDTAAYTLIVEHLRADWLTPVMEGFSALATPTVLVAMLLVIIAFAPGRRPGWCCAVNLVLVTLLNLAIKSLVQRPRPEGFRLVTETGFSFPSGHSMAAMAFYGLIVWLIWHYESDRRKRAVLTAAFSLIILMIGISRIYLGVHYASDVLGGFCVSLIWLSLYVKVWGQVPNFHATRDRQASGRR